MRRSGRIWGPGRRLLTTGLVLTASMVALEYTAVIPVLPLVEDDLGHPELYGWVMSAHALGGLVGIVAGGERSDRDGPALPFAGGLALFATGLAGAGLAPSMPALVLARAVQGLGGGAMLAARYVGIGRTYPERLRPRMLALLTSAWVVPSLVGPGVGAVAAELAGWRLVFLGLLPLVPAAALCSLPGLRALGPAGRRRPGGGRRLADSLRVSTGAGLLLAGFSAPPLGAVVLVAMGVATGLRPLARLLPPGTLRARHGLPAAVLDRGLLTFAFFGADTLVPLAVTALAGGGVAVAGLAVTAANLAWTAGAWAQERTVAAAGERRLVRTGLAVMAAGIGCEALVATGAAPLAAAVAGWAVCGFGAGLAYAPTTLLVLAHAPAGGQGRMSAAMELSDSLGVALGTGLAGLGVALGHAGGQLAPGLTAAFVAMGGAAVLGVALGRRLPAGLAA